MARPGESQPRPLDRSKDFRILEDTGEPGDGHIQTEDGARLWGKYGASGVLVRNVDKNGVERFLLVQRGPSVSSNRWKWQLPGGALDSAENDYQGAARELSEELEPPDGFLPKIKARGEVVFNHPSGWHYTNIAADAPEMFTPHPDGTETNDAQWFTRDQIAELPLQPAFRDSLNHLMDKFGSPHVKLPEVPIEPDLSYWEPKPETPESPDYYPDETLDLTSSSRNEVLKQVEQYRQRAEEAGKRGDAMDQFLWQSRHDHLLSQIDASK